MTKSTGARERMHRRHELWQAELKLRRVLLHLMSGIAWGGRLRDERERQAQSDAFDRARDCYKTVLKEQEECR